MKCQMVQFSLMAITMSQLLFTNASADNMSPEVRQSVQAMIDSVREKNKICGIQFCAVDSSDVLTCWTSGYSDNSNKIPMKTNTTLRIGSTTKLFTGYLIMKLVQDSLLNLDDHLAKWYPDFPYSDQITIQNLLMHTSGAMEILKFPKFLLGCVFSPHKTWTSEELIAFVSKNSRNKARQPNIQYEYSNTNFILLGAIAEKMYHKNLGFLIDSLSHDCLLVNTSYIALHSNSNNFINGYDKDFIPFPWGYTAKPDNTSWTSVAAGSGGIISNAEDLCRFFRNYVTGNSLSMETKAKVFNFQNCAHKNTPEITGVGLGVFRMMIEGREYWGHEGQMIGSESLVLYSSSSKRTLCVIGNRSAFRGKFEIISKADILLSQ